jgi:DNA-binding MarR family transcriptional regulator
VPGHRRQVQPHPRDARAAFAAITPRGQALVRKARDSHHQFLRQTFAATLDDADVADLARIMDRISGPLPPAGTFPHGASPDHQ